MDLLVEPRTRHKWIPGILCRKPSWKIMSGKWDESPDGIVYRKDPEVLTGENIAIFGSPCWSDYTFSIKLRFLTDSIRPPEGGAILYYLLKNLKNNYSLHICFSKKTLELMKRSKSKWSTIGETDFDLEKDRIYEVMIKNSKGMHSVSVDGDERLEAVDHEIKRGSVGIGVKYCDVQYSDAHLRLDRDIETAVI